MSKEALLNAANVLRNLSLKDDEKFNMDWYGTQTACGTSACAAGWLLLKGAFPGYCGGWKKDHGQTEVYSLIAINTDTGKRDRCISAVANESLGLMRSEAYIWCMFH